MSDQNIAGLIDSHAHLDREHFPEGAAAVLQRAREAGLEHVVVVGVGADATSARHAIGLAEQHSDVSAISGMHPHEASELDEALFDELAALCDRDEVVAVGEIGLDYHYMFSPADVQQQVFRRMIRLARELKKPIVIHTREAAADTLRILTEERAEDVGGIIHCFSEDRAFAERALEMDFDVSFSGIVSYKNASTVHEVARWLPADRLLVETDCPYLAPVPKRGKRCEPAFVVHTAGAVAKLRGESLSEVARSSTANARRRLRLGSRQSGE